MHHGQQENHCFRYVIQFPKPLSECFSILRTTGPCSLKLFHNQRTLENFKIFMTAKELHIFELGFLIFQALKQKKFIAAQSVPFGFG